MGVESNTENGKENGEKMSRYENSCGNQDRGGNAKEARNSLWKSKIKT